MLSWRKKAAQLTTVRFKTVKTLLWRPTKWIWVVVLLTGIGAYDVLVAQFVPEGTQDRFPRMADVLPGWSWQAWVILALGIALVIVFERAHRLLTTSRDEGFIHVVIRDQEWGYIDWLIEWPKALKSLGKLMNPTARDGLALARQLQKYRSASAVSPKNPKQTRGKMRKLAKHVGKYNTRLGVRLPKMQKESDIYCECWKGIVDWWEQYVPDWETSNSDELNQLQHMTTNLQETVDTFTIVKEEIVRQKTMNFSGDLTSSLRRLENRTNDYSKLLVDIVGTSQIVLDRQAMQLTPDKVDSRNL